MMDNSRNFTTGNITKQLILFSIPLLVTNLLQQLYTMMDSVIVGQFVGSEALAAIGTTGSFTYMLISFFVGLATGGGVIIAQYYGAGNIPNMRKAIHTSVVISIFGGILLTVVGVIVSPYALHLINVPDNVFAQADLYMRIYFGGSLFLTVYNMGAGILRAVGDSRRPLIYLAISSVVNIALNLVFVLCFGMGVDGVAWATLISQAVSAAMVTVHLVRTKNIYKLSLSELKFDPGICRSIFKVGIPAGMQSVLIALSNVIIQVCINSFGSDAMAGVSACGKIDAFIHMPMLAMGLAVTTFVGQNVGAKNYARVHKGTRTAMVLTMAVTGVLGIIGFVFARPLLGIISQDPAVLDYGEIMLRTLAPGYIVFVINEIISGTVRGAGSSVPPMIITLVCLCALRIVWILVMTPVFGDIRVVAYCYPVTWILAGICQVIYYYKGKWRKILQ